MARVKWVAGSPGETEGTRRWGPLDANPFETISIPVPAFSSGVPRSGSPGRLEGLSASRAGRAKVNITASYPVKWLYPRIGTGLRGAISTAGCSSTAGAAVVLGCTVGLEESDTDGTGIAADNVTPMGHSARPQWVRAISSIGRWCVAGVVYDRDGPAL